MKVIYKYSLQIIDEQQIAMPKGAVILTIQNQNDLLCLWAIVDPEEEREIKTFIIVGTGEHFPSYQNGIRYLSTVQEKNRFVWHVFEEFKLESAQP